MAAASSRTDTELLTASAAGDTAAFDEFVRRHRASVFRCAKALARHDADAEDVLQQTFLQAWRSAGSAAVQEPRAWLHTIARHALLRLRRVPSRQTADDVSLEVLGADAGFASAMATPERLAAATEEQGLLHRTLAALPAADREVLVLRELEQMSGEQTAQLLGLSVEAMKSRLHRARLRLVAELRRHLPDGGES